MVAKKMQQDISWRKRLCSLIINNVRSEGINDLLNWAAREYRSNSLNIIEQPNEDQTKFVNDWELVYNKEKIIALQDAIIDCCMEGRTNESDEIAKERIKEFLLQTGIYGLCSIGYDLGIPNRINLFQFSELILKEIGYPLIITPQGFFTTFDEIEQKKLELKESNFERKCEIIRSFRILFERIMRELFLFYGQLIYKKFIEGNIDLNKKSFKEGFEDMIPNAKNEFKNLWKRIPYQTFDTSKKLIRKLEKFISEDLNSYYQKKNHCDVGRFFKEVFLREEILTSSMYEIIDKLLKINIFHHDHRDLWENDSIIQCEKNISKFIEIGKNDKIFPKLVIMQKMIIDSDNQCVIVAQGENPNQKEIFLLKDSHEFKPKTEFYAWSQELPSLNLPILVEKIKIGLNN